MVAGVFERRRIAIEQRQIISLFDLDRLQRGREDVTTQRFGGLAVNDDGQHRLKGLARLSEMLDRLQASLEVRGRRLVRRHRQSRGD